MDFPRTIGREKLQPLLVAVFVLVIPLVHLGGPLLIARAGPHWGWTGGHPTLLNLFGLLPVILGFYLLGWILTTMLAVAPTLPSRVRLGLRPARLVQTGPYARMRHPIYIAEACLWVGMIVLLGSPVCLPGARWFPLDSQPRRTGLGGRVRPRVSHIPRPRAVPHLRRALTPTTPTRPHSRLW
jgi:protein-S-isoprenylcysteine O-methyltransferase Ste14